MDSIKRSLLEVMYFPLLGRCKAYNIFSFLSIFIFAWIRLMVSGSMELVEAKKFVMFGARWRAEAGAYHMVKKIWETCYAMGFGV